MSSFNTKESYPVLRVVRPDEEKIYQTETSMRDFLSSIQGRICDIESFEPVTNIQEKYVNSVFWRLMWFVFWLVVFFPMLILWYFKAEVRTRTLFKPGRWFVKLDNGDAFYLESIFQSVTDFIESENQRIRFGFTMEQKTVTPIKDPWK